MGFDANGDQVVVLKGGSSGSFNEIVITNTDTAGTTTAPLTLANTAATGTDPDGDIGIELHRNADQTTNWSSGKLWVNNSDNMVHLTANRSGTGTVMGVRIESYFSDATPSESFIQVQRGGAPFISFGLNGSTTTAGNLVQFDFTLTDTNGDQNCFTVSPTVQQTSTAGYTVLEINPTITTTGSGKSYLVDVCTDSTRHFAVDESGVVSIGLDFAAGALLQVQQVDAAAQPALMLEQLDLSEEFMELKSSSAADNSQPLVDAADLTTPGSIVGWFKAKVTDDAGAGAIADGTYYVPFYNTPTA